MKAIIFDCDGVLIDSEVVIMQIESAILRKHGLDYTERQFFDKFLGVSNDKYDDIVRYDFKIATGQDIDEEFFPYLRKRTRDNAYEQLDTIAGMEDLIKKYAHIPMAVASNNYGPALLKKLQVTGLDTYFTPHLYSSDNVKNPKPAPDMYLYAANSLNIEPKHCVVVEDSSAGATAAISAGMTVIGFTGGGHCDQKQIDDLKAVGVTNIAQNAGELSDLIIGLQKAVT